eukprot:TRINITY_DN3584_c0_g1_i1.p1 TRINITY_DN3584_c0_g1~~TRINITY_DN3584_c0_g1_i1.p1  ORF type:complete len:293 (+),score=31.01 TRINITY_DN3584_c0_g1_i1:27-905(+)
MRALRVLLSRSFSFFNSNLIKRIYTYVIQLKFTMSFTSFVSLLLVSFAYGQLSLPPTFLPPFSASTNFFPSSTSPPASGLSQFGSFPSFGFSSPPAQTPQELFSNFPRTFSDIFGTGSVFGNFGSSSPLPSLSPIVSDLQAQFNEEVIRAEVEISFPDVDCDTGKSMEFQKTIKAALNVEAGCPAGQDCAEILEVTCGSLKIKIALLIFVNRASTQIDTEASSDEISVGVSNIVEAALFDLPFVVLVVIVVIVFVGVVDAPTLTSFPSYKGHMEESSNAPIDMDAIDEIINL